MGGHTMARGGYVLDTKCLNSVDVDVQKRTATVGPGCLWSDLIFQLNEHGLSPRTMQSYSSFSVGGAVAVNAHGITTDVCCAESVLAFTLVKWDGTEVVCHRGAEGQAGELFRLAIGGYGMFGVMVSITLKVVPNTLLHMEMVTCDVAEFARIYRNVCSAEDVEIKLGRIDITSFKGCQLFVFRRQSREGVCAVSKLPLDAFHMSQSSQVMYKWVLPHAAPLRAGLERVTGRAVDWNDKDERNLLMYESAEPLARLYSPLFELDDTFVLQEFFTPASEFTRWIDGARPILTAKRDKVALLNTTVRFVEQDTDTNLAYARSAAGSFAFVLYFRIARDAEGDKELHGIHTALADLTLGLGGTFYLPYRHHYTKEQLEAAYPAIGAFWERKVHYDPHGMFDSQWCQAYGTEYIAKAGGFTPFGAGLGDNLGNTNATEGGCAGPPLQEAPPCPLAVPVVTQRRDNSYRQLLSQPSLRAAFLDGFLVKIFNVASVGEVSAAMSKAAWDPNNRSDTDIYDNIKEQLAAGAGGPIVQLARLWKSITQLRAQRRELTRETASILARLGRLGAVHDYASVGDHGKMVLAFKDTFKMCGNMYVVHDDPGGDVKHALERGSEKPVGEFVRIDYDDPSRIALPDSCVDLLTMNQGLHHLPQQHLAAFLREVSRVLRPGGLFIVREHNANPELLPMLDLAHSVFNAVTGVSARAERNEIRAFRPLLEWRRIIEGFGLVDTMLYEMEAGDPTRDEMMCFSNGPLSAFVPRGAAEAAHARGDEAASARGVTAGSSGTAAVATLVARVNALTEGAPAAVMELLRAVVDFGLTAVESVGSLASQLTSGLTTGQQQAATATVQRLLAPVKELLRETRPFLDAAKLKNSSFELVPREVFILVQALLAKGERGEASTNELLAIAAITDVQRWLTPADDAAEGGPDEAESPEAGPPSRMASRGHLGDMGHPLSRQGSGAYEVPESALLRQLTRLLSAMPQLCERDYLLRSGFGQRLQTLVNSELGDRPIDALALTHALAPYLDAEAWQCLEGPLEEIIHAPESHPLSYGAVTDEDGPWWRAAMALLGSPKVQIRRSAQMIASLVGMGDIVSMWKVAQVARASGSDGAAGPASPASCGGVADAEGAGGGLSAAAASLLSSTAELVGAGAGPVDPAAVEALVRCLRMAGAVGATERQPEYTWYKLSEWMQVEFVQRFADFMHHTPWFRFPFLPLLRVYFEVLASEFSAVRQRHGLGKALFSEAFLTDAVPGAAMAVLFAQMQLISLPLRLALGDDYTANAVAGQTEDLIVLTDPSPEAAGVAWQDLGFQCSVRRLVRGLDIVTVPSLGAFTAVVKTIALLPVDSLRILLISGHSEVQVRVTTTCATDEAVAWLRTLPGTTVALTFQMPATAGRSVSQPEASVALGIQVSSLLEVVRAIVKRDGVELFQVYDFWG